MKKRKVLWCGLGFLLVAALMLTSCGAATGEQEEEEEEEAVPGEESAPQEEVVSSSKVTRDPSGYDEKEVELSGQTYLTGSPPRLLLDGKSGVNITGNTGILEKGFYRLTGVYDADTNTLNVAESTKEEVKYLAIQAGKELGIDLVPVTVKGLIATTPKEVANMLTSYLSIPNFPQDVPIYPYVVYAKDGLYLALSDTPLHLPAEFMFLYQGKDYSFTFCSGEVKGTLVKTPVEEIKFGPKWEPDKFGGVIIANTIAPLEPIEVTVKEINANPGNYTFKRVSINGSYIVTTATVDYSEIKAPMGLGILTDEFGDFFKEDTKVRLETIDPNRKVWQLRRGKLIGTVIYPTEQILTYLDYSAPLTQSEIKERLKPALIVDSLVSEVEKVADISELNLISGNPSKYWGKVVEFDGYALGINYPLKKVAEAILKTEVPVNVNLLAVGIADKPDIGSQLAIIGLNNELVDENGEVIKGRYRFRVAVTHVPEELVSGVPYADTAFFLLSKEELPIEIPTPELYNLNISIRPSGRGTVSPPGGKFQSGTAVTLTAIPAPGYLFDCWSGDASGTDNPITIPIDSDKSVTAHFKEKEVATYSLSVSVDPSGSGTVTPSSGDYLAGTDVTLIATAALGYKFDHWSGDVSGTSPTITIPMDSDKSVTACFKRILLQSLSRNPLGQPEQMKRYITPDDPKVEAAVNDILSGEWRWAYNDFNALRAWLALNISPISDQEAYGVAEYWQLPAETLELGTGDCEDYAILLCTLLRANGIPADQVYVIGGYPSEGERGHAFLYEHWYKGIWRAIEPQIDPITDTLTFEIMGWADAVTYIRNVWCFNDESCFQGKPALLLGVYEFEVDYSLYPLTRGATAEFERHLDPGQKVSGSVEWLADRAWAKENYQIVWDWSLYVYAPDGSTTFTWSGTDLQHNFSFTPTVSGTYKVEILKRDYLARCARLTIDPPDWKKR